MMTRRIFLTGASGAMGQAITRTLVDAGHEVIGAVRSADGAAAVIALGARPVHVDLCDASALAPAMAGCDLVAHFATKIPTGMAATRVAAWAENDRLRRDGTAALLEAATATAVPRCIFESISLAYPDGGADWTDEAQALDPVSPVMRSALDAEAELARFAERGGEALLLRFGRLYGPGRASADLIGDLRRRRMPVVGRGDNFVSSVHVDDVGAAVAAAIDATPGIYNVVDDSPMTQRELMHAAARSLGASAPRSVPVAVARLLLGHAAPVLTVSHRVSNRRFKRVTGWTPRHVSAVGGWAAAAAALRQQVTAA